MLFKLFLLTIVLAHTKKEKDTVIAVSATVARNKAGTVESATPSIGNADP